MNSTSSRVEERVLFEPCLITWYDKIEVLEKDIPYEELLTVLQDAFKERLEQGLNFVCATFTLNEFIENMKGMSAIVARQDEENVNRIVGFQKFIILNQCFDTDYLLSALRCRLRFHADGTNTKLLNCYLKIRQK